MLQGAFAWPAYVGRAVQHDGIALRSEYEACRTGKLAVHARAGPATGTRLVMKPLASPILLGINALGEKYSPDTLQIFALKSHCDPFLLEIREEFRMAEWPLRCLYKDIPPSVAFPVLCAVMGPGFVFRLAAVPGCSHESAWSARTLYSRL